MQFPFNLRSLLSKLDPKVTVVIVVAFTGCCVFVKRLRQFSRD